MFYSVGSPDITHSCISLRTPTRAYNQPKLPHHLLAAVRINARRDFTDCERQRSTFDVHQLSAVIPLYHRFDIPLTNDRAGLLKSVADGAFALSLLPPPDGGATFVCPLPLGSQGLVLTNGLVHRTPTSDLRSGQAPRSYGALPTDHDTPSNAPSDISLPDTPDPTAPDLGHILPPGLIAMAGVFQKRTSRAVSRGVAICLVIILLQSVLIICRSDALAMERSALTAEREKLEQDKKELKRETGELELKRIEFVREMEMERIEFIREMKLAREELGREMDELELERIGFKREMELVMEELKREMDKLELERTELKREMNEMELERIEFKRERIELEKERLKWEREEQKWKLEGGEWKSEREKLGLERERLRLERELWERAREDRVPQGAFWEVIWSAWDCCAYGKREYSGMLQSIPEGWTAVDACMNMPVEIKGVTVRRPDRCAFVEGSPHIHGYWIVDWDQPDCKPWYQDFKDAVSQISPFPSVHFLFAHSLQGCMGYRSGLRRIEAELVGIIDREEQDWWLLCGTTPVVWNQTTYTSPSHCQKRVSGFPPESLTGEADTCPRLTGWKEGRDVGCSRRELSVTEPTSSVKGLHS